MKNSLFFLVFLFSGLFGHSQTPLNIELNFALGDSFLIEYGMHSSTDQLIMGAPQKIETDEKMSIIMHVTNVSPFHVYTVRMVYKSYQSKVESKDMLETFTTDSADVQSDYRFMLLLIDCPIEFQITRKGKLISFNGSKVMLRNDSIDNLDENALLVANNRFGEQIPKSILSFLHCPTIPVRINYAWNFPDTVHQYPFRYTDITSSLIDANENTYQLKFTGKISTDEQKFYKTNRIFISYQMSGNTENLGRYDKKTGMFDEAEMIQVLSGTAGMKYSESSGAEYTWPITINNEIRLTSKKL
jgi:hypothetical protein